MLLLPEAHRLPQQSPLPTQLNCSLAGRRLFLWGLWLLLYLFFPPNNLAAFYSYSEWTTVINTSGLSEIWRKEKKSCNWWGKVGNQESVKKAEVEAGAHDCTTILVNILLVQLLYVWLIRSVKSPNQTNQSNWINLSTKSMAQILWPLSREVFYWSLQLERSCKNLWLWSMQLQ